jgi:PTH2 family peptidyl-tRNA hydrolase
MGGVYGLTISCYFIQALEVSVNKTYVGQESWEVSALERQTKQVILVRTDIKLPKGKLAAQVAHASMSCILQSYGLHFEQYNLEEEDKFYQLHPVGEPVAKWLNGSFTKVCLKVDSEDQMRDCYQKAEELLLPASWIVDEGRTVFKEPTVTCCAIGPWWSDEIDEVTGRLKLL